MTIRVPVPHRETLAAFCFLAASLTTQVPWADTGDQAALLQALPKSKMTLVDGLKQSTKGTEVPVSAKSELDHDKQLSLSVYMVEKGLAVDAEHNVLKELAGSPEKTPWAPEVAVFKDLPHVAPASEHSTIAAIAKRSLADIVARAEKASRITFFGREASCPVLTPRHR